MKKFFTFVAAALMAVGANAEVLVSYQHTATLPAGFATRGTTAMKNQKIHSNADGVDCIQFANGYSTDNVYNGNSLVVSYAGGFKTGDKIKVAGFFNNSDDTKQAAVSLLKIGEADAVTAVWTSANFINGRTVATDPVEVSYVLTEDMDSLVFGRTGNTGTNIYTLQVVRGEEGEDPTPEAQKPNNPAFSKKAGTYYEAIKVAVTCSTAEASVMVSVDGAAYAAYADSIAFAFVAGEEHTIAAYAVKEELCSDTVSAKYTFKNMGTNPWGVVDGGIIYDLAGLTATDWEVNENGKLGTRTMDGAECPIVEYLNGGNAALEVTMKGDYAGLKFLFDNKDAKANILTASAKYLQLDGKNVIMTIDNCVEGDTIVICSTSKNDVANSTKYSVGYSTTSNLAAVGDTCTYTDKDAPILNNYAQFSFNVFVCTAMGTVKIKEVGNGGRIAKIYVAATREAATPDALEDVATEPKAIKVVENGQIVIIKDGVRYSVLGAKL